MKKMTPIHPGEVLMEEFLRPMNVSQYRLALEISVPPRRINEIVLGKRAITADTALRLARYFGNSEDFWMNLQKRYDLEIQRDRLGERLSIEVAARDIHTEYGFSRGSGNRAGAPGARRSALRTSGAIRSSGGVTMSETRSHKSAKSRATGKSGRTEVPISRGRSLDAATTRKAFEVERSGSQAGLEKAARRLKASGKPQKVLQVPQKDMEKAVKAMRSVGVGGTVKNMGGTKRRSVPKK